MPKIWHKGMTNWAFQHKLSFTVDANWKNNSLLHCKKNGQVLSEKGKSSENVWKTSTQQNFDMQKNDRMTQMSTPLQYEM